MQNSKSALLYGWGINDATHCVCKKGSICPYYQDWCSMIRRCFDLKFQEKHPTYKGCTVCEEWKYLSNFIKWVDSQPNKDWQNCQLDKDLLFTGNKHYSPDTCIYIMGNINKFVIDRSNMRGNYMLGVHLCKISKKNPYFTQCGNPFNGKQEYLGRYPTELEAHLAWKAKKHEHACKLADLQDDPRVKAVLENKYK